MMALERRSTMSDCYYCGEPLEQDGTTDWCWIKTGPDGSGCESLKVHDSCAAPLIQVAKKVRDAVAETPTVDPVPVVVAELEKAGFKSEDLDDVVHEVGSRIASDTNNGDMEQQARFLMSNGYDPRTLIEANDG